MDTRKSETRWLSADEATDRDADSPRLAHRAGRPHRQLSATSTILREAGY